MTTWAFYIRELRTDMPFYTKNSHIVKGTNELKIFLLWKTRKRGQQTHSFVHILSFTQNSSQTLIHLWMHS